MAFILTLDTVLNIVIFLVVAVIIMLIIFVPIFYIGFWFNDKRIKRRIERDLQKQLEGGVDYGYKETAGGDARRSSISKDIRAEANRREQLFETDIIKRTVEGGSSIPRTITKPFKLH